MTSVRPVELGAGRGDLTTSSREVLRPMRQNITASGAEHKYPGAELRSQPLQSVTEGYLTLWPRSLPYVMRSTCSKPLERSPEDRANRETSISRSVAGGSRTAVPVVVRLARMAGEWARWIGSASPTRETLHHLQCRSPTRTEPTRHLECVLAADVDVATRIGDLPPFGLEVLAVSCVSTMQPNSRAAPPSRNRSSPLIDCRPSGG
jgi:hypothetical protein